MSTTTYTAPGLPTTYGLMRTLADCGRCAAFWSAVVLPLFHLPVFAAGHVGLGAALLAVNAVALLAGHGHNARDE